MSFFAAYEATLPDPETAQTARDIVAHYHLRLSDRARALMDEETPAVPVCTCKEKCAAGAVDTSCSVCKTNLSECAGREKVRDPEPEPEQPEKKSGSGLLAVVALLVLAGGGAFAYVKFIKPNRSGVKVSADPDEYDFPDEEYINEDEPAEAETEAEHE